METEKALTKFNDDGLEVFRFIKAFKTISPENKYVRALPS